MSVVLENNTVVRGILNVGNTCYLNSAIQVLFHANGFASRLELHRPRNADCIARRCLSCVLKSSLERYRKDSVTDLYELRELLAAKNYEFRADHMADSAEALTFILDSFDQELMQSFLLSDTMLGTCQHCREVVTTEYSVPICVVPQKTLTDQHWDLNAAIVSSLRHPMSCPHCQSSVTQDALLKEPANVLISLTDAGGFYFGSSVASHLGTHGSLRDLNLEGTHYKLHGLVSFAHAHYTAWLLSGSECVEISDSWTAKHDLRALLDIPHPTLLMYSRAVEQSEPQQRDYSFQELQNNQSQQHVSETETQYLRTKPSYYQAGQPSDSALYPSRSLYSTRPRYPQENGYTMGITQNPTRGVDDTIKPVPYEQFAARLRAVSPEALSDPLNSFQPAHNPYTKLSYNTQPQLQPQPQILSPSYNQQQPQPPTDR
ncbi:hypothetical protein Pelo_4458 [Pelomyxa schiedti]|nr:hypothetical protein Pelo_4458 [Pelomyxa schiedti]